MRSGAIWGGVARDLGQIAGGAIQQHGERKSEEQRSAAIGEALGSFGGDPNELYRRLVVVAGPEDALAITKARVSLDGITDQKDAENQQRLNDVMAGAAKLPYDVFAEGYASILEKAAPGLRAFEFFDVPPDPTPEFHQQLQQWTAKDADREAPVDTVDAEGNPVRRRPSSAEIEEGVPLWKKPDTAKAPPTGEAAYTAGLEREKGAPLTPQERLQAHAQYATSGRAPAEADADEGYYLAPEGVVLSGIPMADKNKVQREASERGIPAFQTGKSQEMGILLAGIHAEAQELQALLKRPDVAMSIGPFMGRIAEGAGKLMDLPPKVRRAAQLMYALSDTELRKRSGAQITEPEMKRLLRFVFDPTRPLDHNILAVEGMLKSSSRDYKALSGVLPPGVQAPASGDGTGGLPPETQQALNNLFPPEQ